MAAAIMKLARRATPRNGKNGNLCHACLLQSNTIGCKITKLLLLLDVSWWCIRRNPLLMLPSTSTPRIDNEYSWSLHKNSNTMLLAAVSIDRARNSSGMGSLAITCRTNSLGSCFQMCSFISSSLAALWFNFFSFFLLLPVLEEEPSVTFNVWEFWWLTAFNNSACVSHIFLANLQL